MIHFIEKKTYIDFFRIFGELINGGTDVIEAIMLLETKKQMKPLQLDRVRERYKQGDNLSDIFLELKFPSNFATIIEIGEASNGVGQMLVMYSKIEEENRALKSKIITLLFPFFLVLVASIGTMFIGTKVMLPMLSGLFETFNAELPLPTQLLMKFADHMLFYFISLVIVSVVLFWFLFFVPLGKKIANKIMLKNPLTGNYIEVRQLYIFASILILLEENKVDILDGLDKVSNLFGYIYRIKIKKILQSHIKGDENIWSELEDVDTLFDGSLILYNKRRDVNVLKSFIERVDETKSKTEKSLETRIELVSLTIGGAIVLMLSIALLLPTMSLNPTGGF